MKTACVHVSSEVGGNRVHLIRRAFVCPLPAAAMATTLPPFRSLKRQSRVVVALASTQISGASRSSGPIRPATAL